MGLPEDGEQPGASSTDPLLVQLRRLVVGPVTSVPVAGGAVLLQ